MRICNRKIAFMAVLTAASMLLFTGCWGNNNKNTSSGSSSQPSVSQPLPESSSAPSVSEVPGVSDMPGISDVPGVSGVPGVSNVPGISNVPGVSGVPGVSDVPGISGITDGNISSKATLGTDFEGIGALPAKAMDWGPGGPVDALNRPQSAVAYNQKFGCYNAFFIGPEQKQVYMTFDEGYEYGLTGQVLDTLKEKKVRAIFFVTYDFANRSGELVQRMIDEGHIVGNHSYSHKNYSTLSPKQAADDLLKMHDFIKDKFHYDMTYFRFPSGNFNEQSMATVQAMGYKTLFWSFAYKDWITDQQPEPGPAADKMVKAVCPGSIYLLHAVSTTNNQILGQVIDRVRAEGYQWGDPAEL